MTTVVRALLIAISMLMAGAASGSPCGGFTDVDSTAFSAETCQSVEWVKNRTITTGCTSATLYCPNDTVRRSQMALFMKRLGSALEPKFLYTEQDIPVGTAFTTSVEACIVGPFVVDFPRVATMSGWIHAHPSPSPALNLLWGAVYSTDGGMTWANFGGAQKMMFDSGSLGEFRTMPVHSAAQPLAAGQSVLFAIRMQSPSPAVSQALIECVALVRIDNRNASSSPFDPDAALTGSILGDLQR